MSDYVEQFSSKVDWAIPFQRTGRFPLERSDLFASYADAVKYAAGNIEDPDSRKLCGTSYVGQIITVIENGSVSAYQISTSRTLSQVGRTYSLPVASDTTLGGVKINKEKGIGIDEFGFIYADLPALTIEEIDEITSKIL